MTPAATEFITPLTLQALSGNPVHVDLLDTESESAMGHIDFARWADLILVAPASADFIARLAAGQGDDLLTTLCLAAACPIAIAPAMNQAMWSNASTAANCSTVAARGITLFGPDAGLQACGDVGLGRMLDVEELATAAAGMFPTTLLDGLRVVVTAGPTREAIDPVRYISNHSSGKQGYAIAEAAVEAGADVILISGPTGQAPPDRVRVVDVISADDMFEASMTELSAPGGCDIFVGVAAVADYRPVTRADQKIKKTGANDATMTIELTQNRDIIAAVAGHEQRPFTVGFAAETSNVVEYARGKLSAKGLDMVVANDVSDTTIGFNSDNNRTTVLWQGHEETLPLLSKPNVARRIVELIADRLPTEATAGAVHGRR